MKKNIAVWFVVGFVCGVGSLLAAIAGLPGDWLRPERAEARPIEHETDAEVLSTLERINHVLGELGAMFTEGGNDAPGCALSSDLQTVRSQLELYKIGHLDIYPGVNTTDGSFDGGLFVKQLTGKTNSSGEVGRDTSTYPYGPYLQSMISNPFVEDSKAAKVTGGRGPCPGDGQTGWYFDTATGAFSANDPDHKGW